MTYEVRLSPSARHQLAQLLPEAVATAALEFIRGPLRDNPQRVGKRLRPPQDHLYSARRGSYRILYSIKDDVLVVEVVRIEHRRDAYRP